MLEQYIHSTYLTIIAHPLFFIELTLALIIFLVGVFFFKKQTPVLVSPVVPPPKSPLIKEKSPIIITSQDIKAIAGEDIMTTQLDLARAYMEIGKKKLAKKILDHVAQNGDLAQRQTAQYLMTNL